MEPLKSPVNIQRSLAPLSSMISFKNLIVGVICSRCIIPNCSHPSCHRKLFQHLGRLFMDDYHEFRCAHDIRIEE
jgi:hypothetical protein